MKAIILLLLSVSIFANTKLEKLAKLTGVYTSSNCKLEIRDVQKNGPLGYGINFPEWKYQVILSDRNGVIMEHIIADKYRDIYDVTFSRNLLTVDFYKEDQFFSTEYLFDIGLSGNDVIAVDFKKKGKIFGSYSTKKSCRF